MSSTDWRALASRNRYTPIAKLWLIGALVGFVLPLGVHAGDWDLSTAMTGSATQVDRSGGNDRSGNDGSGTVFQLSPSLRLSGSGGRTSADINYRPTLSAGTNNTDPRPLAHNLTARGRVDVVENFFVLGGNAAARVSGGSSTSGSSTVDEINFNADNGRQSFSYGLTPEFGARVNRYANFVSENSVDWVTYSGGSNDFDTDNSYSTRLHAGLRSSRGFGRFSWQTDLSERSTHYDERDDRRREGTVGVGYRLNRQWSLRGNVGYEENDVQTNRSNSDGLIWNVGTGWTPNPRTSVNADYGMRYFGDTYSADVQHRTRRTSLSLRLDRDVTSRRTAELVDSFFFLTDDQGDILLDPSSGDPVVVNIPQVEQLDEDFVRTRLSGGVTVTGRRSSLSVTGTVEDRVYEISPIDEDSYDVTLRFTRRISSNLTATVRGDLSHTGRGDGQDSDTYTAGISLNRQLGRRTNASINLQHRDRSGNFSNGDFTENRIGVSLTTRFL